MKLLTILFIFSATMAIIFAAEIVATAKMEEESSSLRGISRFLAQDPKAKSKLTCNKFPRICRAKNSPGPDCCKKKCVNVKKDRLNCGRCGHKCRFTEICCKGKCVNASFDKRNCGRCSNKCKKGEYCVYGMCNYA